MIIYVVSIKIFFVSYIKLLIKINNKYYVGLIINNIYNIYYYFPIKAQFQTIISYKPKKIVY